MRILPLTLFSLLAGCVTDGTAEDAPSTSSAPFRRETVPPQAPLRFDNLTIFADNVSYPQYGNEPGAKREFEIPTGARAASLFFTVFRQCPAGTDDDAGFTLASDAGQPRRVGFLNSGGGLAPDVGPDPFICTSVPPRTTPVAMARRDVHLHPPEGTWKLGTVGSCTCSVGFMVTAETPRA